MAISSSKQIAQNTVFLYFRMLIVIVVTLYTSRVILEVLGVDDFGIYNIVGGVVILFSFMKGTVTTAIQRYINVAIGKSDLTYELKIFSSGFVIIIYIILILVILLETIGVWILQNYINIPIHSRRAAFIVYQISVATFAISTLRVPYEAMILAHQKMSFYAGMSIVEACLKLGVIYILLLLPTNKLILYAYLILAVTCIINILTGIYVHVKFKVKLFKSTEKTVIQELSSFSGWNIFGSIADIGYQQGTNIILNMFFGVSLNATMGIANQVKGAVYNLVRNLITAANPQIFQLYASGSYQEFQLLVLRISKVAFFLFLIFAAPLILNMEYILHLWLKDIPPHETVFCRLILLFCLIDSLIGPLWTSAQAEGKIKRYQLISSSILLLNLPFTFIGFKYGLPSYSMLWVQILVVIISLTYRVWYLDKKKIIGSRLYIYKVILPVFYVFIVSMILYVAIQFYNIEYNIIAVIVSSIILEIGIIINIIFLGFNPEERSIVLNYLKNRICHK